jgi:hypothetical protein
VKSVKTVRSVTTHGRITPASELICTATDCERDAVMAVLTLGEFDGLAYCGMRGHRSEVLADAETPCSSSAVVTGVDPRATTNRQSPTPGP